MSPRTGLDAVAIKESPVPAWNRTTVIHPVAQSLYGLSYHGFYLIRVQTKHNIWCGREKIVKRNGSRSFKDRMKNVHWNDTIKRIRRT
jgi:hypothetical protein